MNYQEAKTVLEKQEAAQAVLEKYKELESAHETFGFKTRSEFIKALQELDSRSGKRVRLSPEDKKGVEAAIKAGKTASSISREFGISIPYVYTLKRTLKTGSAPKGRKKK